MFIIIYEVVFVSSIGNHESLGLYFRSSTAARIAKECAKQHGFKKIKGELEWGEKDDYGMLRGVFIGTRKVEE